jgi:hypothetical protein
LARLYGVALSIIPPFRLIYLLVLMFEKVLFQHHQRLSVVKVDFVSGLAMELSIKYSSAIDYLMLTPDLNRHSGEYFLLAIYEALIRLFVYRSS